LSENQRGKQQRSRETYDQEHNFDEEEKMTSTQGPMFIPLPPGLADLRAYHLETCLSSKREVAEPPFGFAPPPGLPPPPGKCPGDLLRAVARSEALAVNTRDGAALMDLEGGCPKDNVVWPSESVGTRCSTDEPSTPQAPPTPESSELQVNETLQPFEDEEVDEFMQPWSPEFDEAEIEIALEPVLKEILGQDKQKGKGKEKAPGSVRWWTRPTSPLLCPLSGFPTCLLPYPPFKLRVDPARSAPHRLVDGKFLAMTCIVTGRYSACGRQLQASDISALDEYIHRCKLGPYRPGRAVALAQQAANSATPEERETAAQDLEKFAASARTELGKVRRIQENRLAQIKQALPSHLQAAIRFEATTSAVTRRRSSMTSSASTRASFSSDWSTEATSVSRDEK